MSLPSPRLAASSLLLAAGLVGCLGVEHLDNEGMVCLGEPAPWDSGASLSIEAGQSTPVTVVFSTCASGSTQWKDESCSVVASGGQITVEASAVTRTPRSVTDDCNWVDFDCGTVTLDEGTHVLSYGGAEQSFEVPYAGASICVQGG